MVAIPRAAVAKDGYALVWDDNRTTLRAVTLGADLDGDRVEVVSGIAAGREGGAGHPVSGAPRLRPDLTVVEQTYRGEQSYIVKDPKSRKYFRFRPVEVQVLQQFDGARSAADIAAELTEAGIRLSAARWRSSPPSSRRWACSSAPWASARCS